MMTDSIALAVDYLQHRGEKPDPQAVVSALLAAEKQSKQEKRQYHYSDLLGNWRLGFVSGTQTVRSGSQSRPMKKPGKGRFLPSLVKVEIAYSLRTPTDSAEFANSLETKPNVRLNKVSNTVAIGSIQLCLSGPTRFWPKPNALAFDFTNVALSLGNWTPYTREIRGGKDSSQKFSEYSLKDQAFFSFFLVESACIAARGKGGGLALWTRSSS